MLELNPEQCRAVEHGEGPLVVIAGPGSGKTRVITERVVYLLRNVPGLEPQNILAVTFTNKAAGEMKARVGAAPGHPPKRFDSAHRREPAERLPHISTFHSFCHQVLQERHAGRRLLDKIDVWVFLRQRMEQLGLEFYQKLAEPGAFLHDLNEFFSRCQDELIQPEGFEAYVKRVEEDFLARAAGLDPAERQRLAQEVEKKKELARVFRNSRGLIEGAGCSSLGSLIPETVRLFDREPEVRERYQDRFKYVLVDEFQDSNYAQVELLRRLVAPPYNITAVGDDDQAIYRFRGASHGAFELFGKDFRGHATIYLNRNYRSTVRILRAADGVIARNARDVAKPKLQTDKEEGDSVYLLGSPDYRSEAVWVADEVERLASQGRTCGEIAVLYRSHNYRDLLVEEFRHRNIPLAIRGLSVLSTVVARDLIAYLKLIQSPHDNISLTRVLLARRWRFPEELALEVRKQAARDRCSLFDAIRGIERSLLGQDLELTGWPGLRNLLHDLNDYARRAPVTALFDRLIEALGLAFLPGDPDQVYVNALRKFLEQWEEKSETRKLREFMEYFPYFLEAGGKVEAPELEDSANAVQMMTVHAAKGLEFPSVFILSVARQRFPHREESPVIEFPEELRQGPKPPPNIHLQEERRLFYVAITRAKERLYVSSVSKPGGKPSPFVDDLLADPAVRAQDIERIEVGEMPLETGPRLLRQVPKVRVVARHASPLRLSLGGSEESGAVYPPLAEWAARPPTLGSSEKLHLSATAIETYRECPLKFKFSHYLKVPTGPQAALTFGNIMHQCVRRYFEFRKEGVPRFEEIENVFLDSWRDAGFQDDYQEQAYKKAGLEQLRAFVEKQNVKETLPRDVEKHFALDFGDVVLEGRIDQINSLGPSGRAEDHSVELVDYKTGRPRSQKDADRSLQLSVYALAARRQLKLDPARLTFYHLTNNETVSTARTEKDLEEAIGEVREVAEKIRSLLFNPTPGYVCKRCDFVPICPAHEEIF